MALPSPFGRKAQQLWQEAVTREDGKIVAPGQVRLQNIAVEA
jgi:hypothetical protein